MLGAGLSLESAAGEDETSLESVVAERTPIRIRRPRDDRLDDVRTRIGRGSTEGRRVRRDTAKGRDRETLGRQRLGDEGTAAGSSPTGARQEQHQDGRPLAAACARHECVDKRRLQGKGNTGAIARLTVGPERPAVTECRQPGDSQWQDPLSVPPARIRDETDPACIVFELRVVERGDGWLSSSWHDGGSERVGPNDRPKGDSSGGRARLAGRETRAGYIW